MSYFYLASCTDGIQNPDENGIDCGGKCMACQTCDDEIQNQGEAGVDCGGPCTACPNCDDDIQNQGETGVDCGGPCTERMSNQLQQHTYLKSFEQKLIADNISS